MAVAREGHPHLPPGREPGPQSRRTSTGRTLGGCAAPAFVRRRRGRARRSSPASGCCSDRCPAGRRRGPSSSAPSPCWPSSGSSRARMWRGARPRYAIGLELRVERQELRRGDRVAAVGLGRGRDRGRPGVHAGLRRLAAHRQRLAQPRDRQAPRSGSSGCRRRTPRSASASSSRCRPTARTPTRATASPSAGRSSCAASARSAWPSPCRCGWRREAARRGRRRAARARRRGQRARRRRGGRAARERSPCAWPSSSAPQSFEKVARDAGTQVVAEGDLADGAVVRLPARGSPTTPCRTSPRRTGASAGRSARPRRSRGAGPHRRPAGRAAPGLHCPGPGEVAEWLKALAC